MVFKAVSILVTLELAAVLFQCPNLSLAKVLVSNSNTEQQKLTLFEVSVHTFMLQYQGPAIYLHSESQ